MQEGIYRLSNDRNRIRNNTFGTSFVGPSLYESFRSSNITRIAQNISRNHGPLILNRAREEGSQLIRNNLNSVINELGPLMDSARPAEGPGLNLRSWIRRQQSDQSNLMQNAVPVASESTIIDFGNSNEPNLSNSQSTRISLLFSSTAINVGENSHQENFVNELQEHNDNQNTNSSSNAGGGNTNVTITSAPNLDNSINEATNLGTQSIVTFLQKYVPFVIILLGKAIYDHRAGVLIFLGLLVTFIHSDSVVKREIAKQSRRSLLSLFILFFNLFICVCLTYYFFQDQHLYKSLILIPPYTQPLSLWDLLWIVGITDFMLKFITIQLKAGMACFPARLLPYTARGKWYLFLECISQLYRGLVPIQPWLYYLLESYQGPEKVIGVFLSAAYMVSKGKDLMLKAKLFNKAFWKLLQNVSLGVSPSKEQLDFAGSQCPICHDDYETPVLLHCRHVFCEACVTTWFDTEQTCPLCRTKIADDPTWKDGATTYFAQLF